MCINLTISARLLLCLFMNCLKLLIIHFNTLHPVSFIDIVKIIVQIIVPICSFRKLIYLCSLIFIQLKILFCFKWINN